MQKRIGNHYRTDFFYFAKPDKDFWNKWSTHLDGLHWTTYRFVQQISIYFDWKRAFCWSCSTRKKDNISSDVIMPSDSADHKSCCLLLGGSGSIGQAFASAIRKLNPTIHLIFASRSCTQQSQEFKKLYGDCECRDVDICNAIAMDALLESVAKAIHSSDQQAQMVLAEKMKGATNLLNAIAKSGLTVDCLVVNSSLTAVNGLQGNSDYAAANLFLDSLAQLQSTENNCRPSFQGVNRLVSIQWPAWRASKMFTNSSLSKDEDVLKHSIREKQARKFIQNILSDKSLQQGVLAVTSSNPLKSDNF
uniref:Ketoreductase (KR) domain-containing protein n=1 Tax=Ditylenchus dipsaci TaxID=166011 RepID=A0A915DVH1_9BILA